MYIWLDGNVRVCDPSISHGLPSMVYACVWVMGGCLDKSHGLEGFAAISHIIVRYRLCTYSYCFPPPQIVL